MRILKNNSILKLVNSYIIDASQPSNISYLWNFGSLLAVCLVFQLITGITLAMHYIPNVLEAFNSIEHIMRDVNNGWLVRYLHSNTASAFFFLVFLHIGRGMYYGSYRLPRTLVWSIGTIILIAMMATAFLGYVLPYGQMSLWGATVITNLISAIPWIGQDVVEFIWGGFSVNNATLNRFFALHYLLPFILAALILMHLISLHDGAGSSNPLGITGNLDRVTFSPYFTFKDLITIFILIFVLSVFVALMPNVLGDSENYIMANPMQTPPAIVPEWYLLPFYAILRSIPNKLLGVIAMFSAILAIMLLPLTDLGRSKGLQFRYFSKILFWAFVANFLILMILGACHVEDPYIAFGQISTGFYFFYFILLGDISLIENNPLKSASLTFILHINQSNNKSFSRVNKIITSPLGHPQPLGVRGLESNSWWALLTALFIFMANLVWFIIHPESGIQLELIQGIVNTLESITHLITNNLISKEVAQLFLDALNQLFNILPGVIDFLKNITTNTEIYNNFADYLQNVVLPMIERLIKIIIEYIRSR